jgi:hypothetical protein
MEPLTCDVKVKDVDKKLAAIIEAYGRICATCKDWMPWDNVRRPACIGEGFKISDADYYCKNWTIMNDKGQIEGAYDMTLEEE